MFFRNPRPDAVDPDTGERYDDVIVFWVESEADKQALVQSGPPYFTTPHFDGHPSVLVRASQLQPAVADRIDRVGPGRLARPGLPHPRPGLAGRASAARCRIGLTVPARPENHETERRVPLAASAGGVMAVRSSQVPDDAPDEVRQRAGDEPRRPQTDPTLGIQVPAQPDGAPPAHRLVTIGDSLTQGFQSAAIYNTDLSYGAIVAYELGWLDRFRYPRYPGLGGLPLNLEYLLRDLQERFGPTLSLFEIPLATPARAQPDERHRGVLGTRARGGGAERRRLQQRPRGVQLGPVRRTAQDLRVLPAAAADPTNNLLIPLVDNAADRAALRVYPHVGPQDTDLTLFDVARALDADAGVQTLVVWLGANNVLGSVVQLKLTWSQDPGYQDPAVKENYTVWRPEHFRAEFDNVVAQLERIRGPERDPVHRPACHHSPDRPRCLRKAAGVTIFPVLRATLGERRGFRPGP